MENIENEINKLDEIKEWSSKIKKMKEIKELINNQKNKINNLIEMINSGEVKKLKKKVDLTNISIEDLITDFENSDSLDERIKLFNLIQHLIKDIENELFDE
jgi:hypothetical protein